MAKKLVQRKKIIVPHNGYIGMLGKNGPIEIPYMETVQRIGEMIMRRLPVYEILSDGSKVKLTLQNYDKENCSSGTGLVQTYEPSKRNKKSETIVVSDEDVKAKSIETVLSESTKTVGANRLTTINNSKVVDKSGPKNSPTTVDTKPNKVSVDQKNEPKKEIIDGK